MIAAANVFLPPLRSRAAARERFPPRALVLGGAEAVALGGAVAGSLPGTGLHAVWSPAAAPAAPELPATPGARSLSARLQSRGLAAVPRGAQAWLALPANAAEAVATYARAAGAVDACVVVTVAGPRPPEIDPLLWEFDLIVVSEPEDDAGVAAMAVAELAAAGVAPVRARPPAAVARWLALAGWGRLPREAEALELARALR